MKQNKIFLVVGVLVILLGFFLSVNTSQKLNATRTELAGLNEELRESSKELASTKSELQDSQKQLSISKTNLQDSQKTVEVVASDIRGFISELDKSKAKGKAATTRANKLTEQLTVTSRALNDAKLDIRLSDNKLGDAMLKLAALSQKEAKLKQHMNAQNIQIQGLEKQLTRSVNLEKSEKERADILGGKLKASVKTLESKLAEIAREQANVSMLRAQLEASIKSSENIKISLNREIEQLEKEKAGLVSKIPSSVVINASIRRRFGGTIPVGNTRIYLSKIPFREIIAGQIGGNDPVIVWGGGKTPRYAKVYQAASKKIDGLVEKASVYSYASDNRGNCTFKSVVPGDYYVLCASGMGEGLGLAFQQRIKIAGNQENQIALTEKDAIPLTVPVSVKVRATLTTQSGRSISVSNAKIYLNKTSFMTMFQQPVMDNDPVFVWSSGKGKYAKVYGVESKKIDALVENRASYSQTLNYRGDCIFEDVMPGYYYVLCATGNGGGLVLEKRVLVKKEESIQIDLKNNDVVAIRSLSDTRK